MANERLSYLLTQLLEKRITEPELHELSAVLLENEGDEPFQSSIETLIRQASPAAYNAEEWEPLYHTIVRQTGAATTPVRRIGRRWLSYAAAVILLLGAGAWFWLHHKTTPAMPQVAVARPQSHILPGSNRATLTIAGGAQLLLDSIKGNIAQLGNMHVINTNGRLAYEGESGRVEYHTLSTPRGGQYNLTLPDGSAIWLNAASSIRYPTAFSGNERKVEITGEAYFEIAANKEKPFIVEVNGTEVRVLGTKFNINAYANEPSMNTTLVEGSVQVAPQNAKAVVLKPGEQAGVSATGLSVTHNANTAQALAWKNGIFDFNNLDLPAFMRQLERWYDIQVKYEGPVAAVRFRGRMDRGVSFDEMLEILTRMEVKYKQAGRTLIMTQ